MTVDPSGPHHHQHSGRTYHFCSERCLSRFREEEPDRFVSASQPPAHDEAGLPGARWTCPMHPEIVRDAPGSCPICGMAL
jgi:Cu+-exporting ATPase